MDVACSSKFINISIRKLNYYFIVANKSIYNWARKYITVSNDARFGLCSKQLTEFAIVFICFHVILYKMRRLNAHSCRTKIPNEVETRALKNFKLFHSALPKLLRNKYSIQCQFDTVKLCCECEFQSLHPTHLVRFSCLWFRGLNHFKPMYINIDGNYEQWCVCKEHK